MIFGATPLLAAFPATARLAGVRGATELDAAGIEAAVARRAAALQALGLRHGDRVVVGEADGVDFLVAIFACWVSGLCAVAVNPGLSADEQANVMATTGASLWIGTARAAMPDAGGGPHGEPARPLAPDEPALILMTSGTTGRPKGIVHSLRALTARITLNIAAIGRHALRETLCVLPVFFGHGLIGNCLTPLFAGGRVHVWTQPDMAEMRGLGRFLAERSITFMSSVPSFWKIATRVSDNPGTGLERVHVGSAPLSVGQWQDIAAWCGTGNVFNLFGMTETANWIGGGSLGEAQGRDGYVGRIWGGGLAVRSQTGDIAPAGRGEVLVHSPSMMLGYWQRPDLDRVAHAGAWFRTGDTGEIDEDGGLVLAGRIKSEINRAGIKIQAEEIDMLLERHPAIAEACAFAIPDPVAGEAVAAAIVMERGNRFDAEAIKAWCREHARADAVPSRLYVLDAIPRNDRGKIVRAEVRRKAESGQ